MHTFILPCFQFPQSALPPARSPTAAMEALPDPLLGRIFAAAGREAGVSAAGTG